MHFIYKQIQQKGLFFYVLVRGQHRLLNPKQVIGKLYDTYSSASKVLNVVYSNRNYTESRVINAIFIAAQFVLALYIILYAYNYFKGGALFGSNKLASNATEEDSEPPVKPSYEGEEAESNPTVE